MTNKVNIGGVSLHQRQMKTNVDNISGMSIHQRQRQMKLI